MFKEVLQLFFGTETGELNTAFDLRQGVVMRLDPESPAQLVFGTLGLFVQDLVAHKEVLYMRGHNAVKLCSVCQNVVKHTAACLPDETGFLIPSTCLDLHRYAFHTNATVKGVLQRLADIAAAEPARLEEMQINLGFNYCPDNFLLDDHLNVHFVDVLVYDWMHVHFVDGIFSRELAAFLELHEPHACGAEALHSYLQIWVWPKCTHGSKELCKKRGQTHTLNGSASEYLSAAQVLRKWIAGVVSPLDHHPEAIRSLTGLLNVVDVLMQAQAGAVLPRQLEDLILGHLRLHLEAYGHTLWTAKFHCSLHLPGMLEKHGILPSCFALERKHKAPKRWMQGRMKRSGWSRGVLEDVTVQFVMELCDPTHRCTQIVAHAASKRLKRAMVDAGLAQASDEVTTCAVVVVRCRNISKGDLVLFKDGEEMRVGLVWFHVAVGASKLACVSEWDIIEKSEASWKVLHANQPRFVSTEMLVTSVVFSDSRPGCVSTVLLPPL